LKIFFDEKKKFIWGKLLEQKISQQKGRKILMKFFIASKF